MAENVRNKRKWEGAHGGSSSHQQNKEPKAIRAHTARQSNKEGYARNLPLDTTWFKETVLLVQAHAKGKELDEEQLAFLADPRVVDCQVSQTITHNAAFQTDDLDAYDSDCDDIYSSKAVLMANLLSYDSKVLSKVPFTETY
nr:hypothetical protein [Tanacetum cinerariifolium]